MRLLAALWDIILRRSVAVPLSEYNAAKIYIDTIVDLTTKLEATKDKLAIVEKEKDTYLSALEELNGKKDSHPDRVGKHFKSWPEQKKAIEKILRNRAKVHRVEE